MPHVVGGSYKGIMPMYTSARLDTEDREEPPAPRTYFPETWLWDLVPVG